MSIQGYQVLQETTSQISKATFFNTLKWIYIYDKDQQLLVTKSNWFSQFYFEMTGAMGHE